MLIFHINGNRGRRHHWRRHCRLQHRLSPDSGRVQKRVGARARVGTGQGFDWQKYGRSARPVLYAGQHPDVAMVRCRAWAGGDAARLWKSNAVTGIDRESGGAYCIETSRGMVSSAKVVNCAGAWAASVAKMVGIDLPVEPLRRMLVPTEP